jgi:hypothetical protein
MKVGLLFLLIVALIAFIVGVVRWVIGLLSDFVKTASYTERKEDE